MEGNAQSDISPVGKGLIEKAQALILLKDILGPAWNDQKKNFLEVFFKQGLPITESVLILKKFFEIKFVDASELGEFTQRLFSAPTVTEVKPAPPPVQETKPVVQEPEKTIWNGVEVNLETNLKDIQKYLFDKLELKSHDHSLDELLEFLNNLNVSRIRETIELDKNDRQFNVLTDLMLSDQRQLFKRVAAIVKEIPAAKKAEEEEKLKAEPKKVEGKQEESKENNFDDNSLHYWGKDAQLLVLPLKDKFHYFCYVDLKEDEKSLDKKGEHVIFCLDISASMNHDEKRIYCAPKSPDHAASSIKKARELIPALTLAALKRGASVTVVVWNYKIYPAIEFTPEMYTDKESGEFIEDKKIEADLRLKTGESVFLAQGGTNMEAALQDIAKRVKNIALKVSNCVIWFLTDGEETIYQDNDKPERIPTNTKEHSYSFFNVEDESGLTGYQKKMVKEMDQLSIDLADAKCELEFHVCHLGEAHPIFLKALRVAVNGHFHAITDVANIAKEMSAMAIGSNSQIIIYGKNNKSFKFSAATADAALYSRGEMPSELFKFDIAVNHFVKIKTFTDEIELTGHEISPLPEKAKEGVSIILSLEPQLDKIIKSVGTDISTKNINFASNALSDLRNKRIEAITSVARHVRNGSLLQNFLEKILESMESQIDALERLLQQYQVKEGKEFDKTAARQNEMFTEREKLAIEAGLESMRVRLGQGFVSQSNLDKKIQRMVATYGPWARKMLQRRCFVAETLRGENTIVTLMIIEGEQIKVGRAALFKKLAESDPKLKTTAEDPSFSMEIKEKFSHNEKNEVVSKFTFNLKDYWKKGPGGFQILEKGDKLEHTCLTSSVYKFITTYTVTPKTDDLDDACKRLIDPLSFSSFIDLIKENNTLPAYLYTIGANQSIGLLYNAKELLYVIKGGLESTSFDYFRLYWRLAKKDKDTNEVKVPGTFHPANTALPIAPEPLTNLVLSNLMPGLLSEFVTGTPMAPLTGVGTMYIGYLMMHMRNDPHTGIDVSRIGEILATLACWIDNPVTLPKPEEFQEVVKNLVKDQGVSNGDSPGKHMPVRALAYALLDDQYPVAEKYSALTKETLRRVLRLLLVSKLGEEKNENLAKQLITDLADNLDVIDEVPEGELASAERLVKLVDGGKEEDILAFFAEKNKFSVILKALKTVLIDTTSKAFPNYVHWDKIQRLYSVWFSIATYPITKLKDTFKAFRAPNEFENHLRSKLDVIKGCSFKNTVTAFITPDNEYCVVNILPDSQIELLNLTSKKSIKYNYEKEIQTMIGDALFRPALMYLWKGITNIFDSWGQFWKGRKSNCYGLHELDYDVIKALKDPSLKLVETLNTTQLAEYNKAKDHKNEAYSKWVAPKPQVQKLSDEHNTVVKQEAHGFTGKPRLSVIFIGNVDSGKSTTAGHLLYQLGGIDKRTIERLEKDCAMVGKSSFKYAWVFDKLKSERERGVTIETAMWNVVTEKNEIDIIDAPGHRDFIKNMSVGSSLADAAILLVSAQPGEFEAGFSKGGMTREESLVAYTNGIRQFIVLINKLDTVNYAKERFDEISKEILDYLQKLGIDPKTVPVVPASSFLGENLIKQSDKMKWFSGWKIVRDSNEISGFTLLDAMNLLKSPARASDKPLRIPILNAYKVGGVGTVAIGKVVSGTIKRGQLVSIMPTGLQGQTNSIEIFHSNREVAYAGDIVGFNVKNCSVSDISRGMVACDPLSNPCKPVVRFTAQVIIMSHPGQIHVGYCPYMFVHTATFSVKFVQLKSKIDRRTGKVIEENPKSLKSGDAAIVVMEPRDKAEVLETFSAMPPLGRFVMRDLQITVAVGVVKEVEYETQKDKKPAVKGSSKPSKYFK